VKVKPEKDSCHQLSTEAKHSNDALDDSDIELMYPSAAESEGRVVRSLSVIVFAAARLKCWPCAVSEDI